MIKEIFKMLGWQRFEQGILPSYRMEEDLSSMVPGVVAIRFQHNGLCLLVEITLTWLSEKALAMLLRRKTQEICPAFLLCFCQKNYPTDVAEIQLARVKVKKSQEFVLRLALKFCTRDTSSSITATDGNINKQKLPEFIVHPYLTVNTCLCLFYILQNIVSKHFNIY